VAPATQFVPLVFTVRRLMFTLPIHVTTAKRATIPRRHRRGFSVIAVLAILSAALVMTYAMLRAQATSVQLSRNTDRMAAAQQAALTGLTMAIRRMHDASEWGGVPSVYNQSLSDTESFTATYSAGDPDLTSADEDWDDYPYRVTVDVEGSSVDTLFNGNVAVANVRAVVRLVPLNMPDELTDWETVLQYTVYQTDPEDVIVELPFRADGPVRFQGPVEVLPNSTNNSAAREQYLEDLQGAALFGAGDYRPFSGPVHLPYGSQDAGMFDDLTVKLGTPVVNTTVTAMPSDWDSQPLPNTYNTYRLYTGGPQYTVQTIAGFLSGATYEPDPVTNPAGLFKQGGNLILGNSTTIRGTLIVRQKVTIDGTNVDLAAADLVPLDGTTEVIRLPSVIAEDLDVATGTVATVTGLVTLWDEFEVQEQDQSETTTLDFNGNMVTARFSIEPREKWVISNWGYWHLIFGLTAPSSGPNQFFPIWLAAWPRNFYPYPLVTMKQEAEPPTYHWKRPDANEPIYIPRDGDEGLFWDILRVEVEP